MYVFFLFVLALFSSDLYAISKSPGADGEVSIKIINNTPCIYINNTQLSGWYVIKISGNNGQGNIDSWRYRNSFKDHYPLESQCIPVNSSNFQNLKLKENEDYFIGLIPDLIKHEQFNIPPSFDGFSSDICLKQNKEKQLQIQDYIYGKCMDREPEMPKAPATDTDFGSWFSRFWNWFKGLW